MKIKYNNHLIRIERIIFIDYRIPINFFIGNNQVIFSNIFMGTVCLSLIQNNKIKTIELIIENYPYGNTYTNATMYSRTDYGLPLSYKLKTKRKIFDKKILSTMIWFIHDYKNK